MTEENIQDVSTFALIHGHHMTEIEQFNLFEFVGESGPLYTFHVVPEKPRVKPLVDCMGNRGGMVVTDKGITCHNAGKGGDVDFRAARVAQLADHYNVAAGDVPEDGPTELPSIKEFHSEYTTA